MKKTPILSALLVALLGTNSIADDNTQYIADSRAAIKQLGGQLKSALKTAMREGGPINAIDVCNTKAPGIANDVSNSSNMQLARTSLKTRNANNVPDTWEQSVLVAFEKRLASGEEIEKLDFAEVVSSDNAKEFRYMKAIPTGEICLKCHGQNIDNNVVSKLDELYPKDKARGFKKGNIRGAFTVRLPL